MLGLLERCWWVFRSSSEFVEQSIDSGAWSAMKHHCYESTNSLNVFREGWVTDFNSNSKAFPSDPILADTVRSRLDSFQASAKFVGKFLIFLKILISSGASVGSWIWYWVHVSIIVTSSKVTSSHINSLSSSFLLLDIKIEINDLKPLEIIYHRRTLTLV